MDDSQQVIIRVAADPTRIDGWSFVLQALEIPHRLLTTEAGRAIAVDATLAARATAALDDSDREAAEAPPPEPAPPDAGPSSVGVAVAMALVAFFFLSGARPGPPWYQAGTAYSDLILRGAWWRAVTALTLHSDLGHVAGNAAAMIIFVSALGRWLGRGVALLLVLSTGFAGNVANAYLHGPGHASLGASTATFGALGLLGGLQFVRRYRWKVPVNRRRRALTAIAACLGVLAMLGGASADVVGSLPIFPRNIDVGAHVFGLGFGLVAGLVTGSLQRRPLAPLGQWALVVLTTGIVAACWWRALA